MKLFKSLGALFRKNDSAVKDIEKASQIFGVDFSDLLRQGMSSTRAMQLVTVFSCVRVLSESVGMLPFKLYRQDGRNKTEAVDHPLYRVLTMAPNSYMTAQEFWELLVACLCLRGNFYAYKVTLYGDVQELLPLDPGIVQPVLNDDWTVEYKVSFKTGMQTLGQDKIWHVRLLTLDGLNGLNPVAYARRTLRLAASTEEHGEKLFDNGAITSGVLETDETLEEGSFERLKKQFNEEHVGLENVHKPLILEAGLKWKPISLNLEDSQFLETRKFQRDEICALFRVPGYLAGSMEKMTLNNIEHLGMSFVNTSLVPIFTRVESRVRVGLLKPDDQATHYGKFNAGGLMRGDVKGRYESYAKGINWGILSPNDCRDLEDMDPREGGDVYLTPLNMTAQPESSNENKAVA